MGLKKFIQPEYYVNIRNIFFNKKGNCIDVVFSVYENQGGAFVMPVNLSFERTVLIEQYKQEKKSLLSEPPIYPELCADREAIVPMWTEDSTAEEKTAYNDALSIYQEEKTLYDAAVQAIDTDAETQNLYDIHFNSIEMYQNSNIEACIYTYSKTLSMFNGVEDVLE